MMGRAQMPGMCSESETKMCPTVWGRVLWRSITPSVVDGAVAELAMAEKGRCGGRGPDACPFVGPGSCHLAYRVISPVRRDGADGVWDHVRSGSRALLTGRSGTVDATLLRINVRAGGAGDGASRYAVAHSGAWIGWWRRRSMKSVLPDSFFAWRLASLATRAMS